MSIINRYSYQFNSKQSSQTLQNGSCIFDLPQPLTLSSDKVMFEIQVNRLNIPYCWYEFNAEQGTSLFSYTVVSGPTTNNFSFSIPDGNYTVSQLLKTVCQLGTAQMVANAYISSSTPWKYSYSEITNRASISLTAPTGALLSVTIQPTFLSDALGYSSASTFTGSPSYTPAVGQKNINVNPSMFIFVTSPSLVQQTNFQALRGSLEPANVICAVDVDVPPRCYIHKDFSVPSVTKFQNTTLSTIQFDLINSRGTSLIGFDLPWCMQFDIFEKVIDVGILEQTIDTYFSKPENSILQSNLLDYALMSDIDPKDLREFESEKEKQIRELNILKEKIMKKQK